MFVISNGFRLQRWTLEELGGLLWMPAPCPRGTTLVPQLAEVPPTKLFVPSTVLGNSSLGMNPQWDHNQLVILVAAAVGKQQTAHPGCQPCSPKERSD